MSFGDFFSRIASSELQNVARHWNKVRGARAMPGWRDIQPSQIAAQLPLIWVYRYDRNTDLFTGRLAGDQIEQIFGKSFRGTPMKDIYPAGEYPWLFARAKRVVCEPSLFLGSGMVFRHVERIGKGERIMLPLADDGADGDGVLGATVYEPRRSAPAEDAPEIEQWFAI
jgi:hypothetical protein